MNKRYMDFVPKKPAAPAPKPKAPEKEPEVDVAEIFSVREEAKEFGVIEDFQDRFVNTDKVSKRPLGKTSEKTELATAKSKKIKTSPVIKSEKPVVKAEKATVATEPTFVPKQTLPLPQAKFVNTERIMKRPLSKNVYKKPIPVAKEEPSGPVAIIDKPEKDSRVGLIVTIIITIILGAAAGTVAFLLMPK